MVRSGFPSGAVFLGWWLGSACLSAVAGPGGPRDFYEVWQVQEGWQPNTVTAVVQSRDGYLWLGTYHGLLRFDGVRFTVFDASHGRLPNGLITSLYEDPNAGLWIGHETGQLTRFVEGRFQPVRLEPRWPPGSVDAISSDEAGDLWLLHENGTLFRLRDGYVVSPPGGASLTRKAILARSAQGKLWLAANGQVYVLTAGKLVPVQFADGQANDAYERIAPARDGGMWLVGNERLRKWREGRWVAEFEGFPRGIGTLSALLETRSGALLVGTVRAGFFLLTPGAAPLPFNRSNGLSQDWIRCLCEDQEGNIWVGTGAGFDGLRPRKVQMVSPPDAWHGCPVLSFSVRPDDSVWVGTEGAGLYYYTRGQWTNFTEASGLSNLYVWSVLATRQDELFVGTFGGGLLAKKGDRFLARPELSRITAPVMSLYQGRRGEIWIGTRSGLYRYEDERLTWFAGEDRLAFPDVRAITEAADGTLWVGMSGGGLASLKDGQLRQFRKTDGLGSDVVVSLYADLDGTLWVGTADNGLTRRRLDQFASLSTGQGLPSRVIFQIVDDGAGNLWLGSQHGIFRASKSDLHRCADELAPTVPCLVYGKAEGLTAQRCSGGFQPGAWRGSDGRLWFPTPKGLAIVDPAGVTTNPVPPPVVIEEVLVDRLPLAAGANAGLVAPNRKAAPLAVPRGSRSFEFRYTGLSFTAPDKVRFKYRLEGLEQEWTDAGAKRIAQYSYLRPGNYTFRVIACNNDEVWNPTGAALAFSVPPYFWQTWWFQLTCIGTGAAGVGAGMFAFARRRVRRKLEQLERQRALERERARIARDIHDDLGASLTRISMLSQTVRSELDGLPAAADVDRIYETARELTRAMDEIVWAVNPKHDTLDSLVTYLGRFAQHFLSAAAIRCRLDVPLHLPAWALTSEVRHNVFLAFKEALHNVVKHARATEVHISFELTRDGFVLGVNDNGCGFDWAGARNLAAGPDSPRLASGNGLLNMQKRLEEVGGRCEWNTAPGEGARVKFSVRVGSQS